MFIYELALAQRNGGRQTQILVSPSLNTSFGESLAAFDSFLAVGAPRHTGPSVSCPVCLSKSLTCILFVVMCVPQELSTSTRPRTPANTH